MAEGSTLDGSSRPAVRDGLTTEEIDGELLVFDPVAVRIHQLDPLGALVWQLLDGSATVDELVEDLAEGFGAPEDRVRGDLAALLEKLEEEMLLEGIEPIAPTVDELEPDRPLYLKDPPAP
jgi:hypothetical protein